METPELEVLERQVPVSCNLSELPGHSATALRDFQSLDWSELYRTSQSVRRHLHLRAQYYKEK